MAVLDYLNKLLGDPNQKALKRLQPLVKKVREVQQSDAIKNLTKEDLPQKTQELKDRIAKGETLDDILPEAFATAAKACGLLTGTTVSIGAQELRWDMKDYYDVQIIGGATLHKGMIAEMRTGEGKTLVCTLPVYLNALLGKGVHVVTVNDYLAKRDAAWMGLLYEALGLSVGVIVHGLNAQERREAYNADVTYGTNNEFGFDYLRDNMASSMKQQVQRPLCYAIVDEVDSILIDEARTPLIISQPAAQSTEQYGKYANLVTELKENDHYNKDEKQRTATLTEDGVKEMERLLGVDNIYTDEGFETVHHIEQALRAHAIYQLDTDYVVQDGQVVIVDEFTGRLMPGRRFGHGLHQAIEAKEKVPVQRESRTLATITFQNLFRLYDKLAGMTGTAKTEEEEFQSIYKLDTLVIPTNKPTVRDDKSDAIYRTIAAKFSAIAKTAKEKHAAGQPVLIGTTSIEKSEALSALLKKEKIPHQVLNAKHHEKEAEIVAEAGQRGAVTIATNMAGRGTDIKLGEGVLELGGLCILGSERHESRRIDNQLRGRSGRQGDPGESQFYVSMEDDLMRLFGGDRLKNLMERLNVPDDVPLENRMVSRSIESAQKRVEGHNFDMRRHVVRYDDVMNKHRTIMYKRRQELLEKIEEGRDGVKVGDKTRDEVLRDNALHQEILEALKKEVTSIVDVHAPVDGNSDDWNIQEIVESIHALCPVLKEDVSEEALRDRGSRDDMLDWLIHLVSGFYKEKCGAEQEVVTVLQAERVITLRSIDTHWMNHIDEMAHLREQVAFAGFAQRDPLIEYQDQAFQKFRALLAAIDSAIVHTLLMIDFQQFAPRVVLEQAAKELLGLQTNEGEIQAELNETGVRREAKREKRVATSGQQPTDAVTVISADDAPRSALTANRPPSSNTASVTSTKKVGRNDPCPCGSGKKYKKCHGK